MPFACIYVPDFVAQAVARGEPALRVKALAVVDGLPPHVRVAGVNEKARAVGVRVGMSRVQVADFPSVAVRWRSSAPEAAARAALLDCASSCSPVVEATAPDTVALDLTGLDQLFRAPDEVARHLARCASDLGFEVNVAVAGNPEAARHAARGFTGISRIPPDREAEHLAGLPVEVLAPPAEILETLLRWGVRTFKDLARLPSAPLSERLGQEGLRLQKLARGVGLRPLIPVEPASNFEEGMELEDPVAELEPLLFILGRLLDQLSARLATRELAARELCLRLELEKSVDSQRLAANSAVDCQLPAVNCYERTVRLPVPMRDSKVFLKLLHLRLKSDPPSAPIIKVTIAAEPAKPRVAQRGLFLPLSPDPEKLEVTLERIAALVGEGNAGAVELVDTHRPDAFRMSRFNPLDSKLETRNSKLAAGRVSPIMALRVFRPPRPATVEWRDGRPSRVFASGVSGRVIAAAGPWRTSGDWWREEAWERDEWDVEILSARQSTTSVVPKKAPEKAFHSLPFAARINPSGAQPRTTDHGRRTSLYRIYRDLASGSWFVQGNYD